MIIIKSLNKWDIALNIFKLAWWFGVSIKHEEMANAHLFRLSWYKSLDNQALWKFWHYFQYLKYEILSSVKINYFKFKSLGKAFWEIGLNSREWDFSTSLLDSKLRFDFWRPFKGIRNSWLLLLIAFAMPFCNFQPFYRLPLFGISS